MRRLIAPLTILTILVIPQLTFGSDLEEFKAAVERFSQAFNSMDADAIA